MKVQDLTGPNDITRSVMENNNSYTKNTTTFEESLKPEKSVRMEKESLVDNNKGRKIDTSA